MKDDQLKKLQSIIEKLEKENKRFKIENQLINEKVDEYELFLRSIKGHIYKYDLDNRYVFCNEQMAKDAGCGSAEEVQGKTNYDLAWKANAAQLEANNERVKRRGHSIVFEEKIDGDTYCSLKAPIYDDQGKLMYVLGNSVHITSYVKDINYQKNINMGKKQLLAILSHDISSVVGNIINAANLAKKSLNYDDPSRQEDNHYLDIIMDDANGLNQRYEHMTDLFKLESGETKPIFEIDDIKAFIDDLVYHKLNYHNKEVKITTHYALTSNIIEFPSEHFGKILTSILLNVIFFGAKNVSIIVEMFHKEIKDELKVSIIVDNQEFTGGNQMDLFDIFEMNPEEISVKAPNLILSICKHYAKVLGGDISCYPEEDSTHFWFSVPAKIKSVDLPKEELALPDHENIDDQGLDRSLRILVVEDSPLTQCVFKSILEAGGCEVTIANNGKKGYKILRKGHFDLVICDIIMSGGNGFDFIREVRNNTIYDNLPIIVATASKDKDEDQYLKCGFTAVIYKPFYADDLLPLIRKLVKFKEKFRD